MKKILITNIVLLITFYLFTAFKKDEPKVILSNNKLLSEQDKKVDDVVKSYMQNDSTVGLSIGLLKEGKTYQYGYGELVKDSKLIPNENSVFEIGSITKTFTAALIINLFKEKKLNLNAPINQFLPSGIPSLEKNSVAITVQHLLNHTSGLPRLPQDLGLGYDPQNPYKHYDSIKVYNYLKTVNLVRTPGEKFEYSNLAMGLAGLIIERLSGKSYSKYLGEKILEPLALSRTKAENTFTETIAKGYSDKGKEVPYWNFTGLAGAGCIYSNVGDLLKYATALLNPDSSPNPDVFNQVKAVTYQSGKLKIASAWLYLPLDNKEVLMHDGGTGGFRSFIYIFPSKKTALVLLANNANDKINEVANSLALKLLR